MMRVANPPDRYDEVITRFERDWILSRI